MGGPMNRLIFGQLLLLWSCIVSAAEIGKSADIANCGQLIKNSHEKIFSTFVPSVRENLNMDDLPELDQRSEDILQVICQNGALKKAIRFLSPALINWPEAEEERAKRFYKLIRSPLAEVAKAAKEIRFLYVYLIYNSKFGKKTADYTDFSLPIFHEHIESYSKQYSHELKSSIDLKSLIYDRKKKEVRLNEKEFDYLVIGSGPAGSVLGHELRRQGKKVLIVEKGALPIPGAMDASRIDEFLEMKNMRTTHNRAIIVRNGEAVGGGSSVNVDLAFPPTMPTVASRIDRWRREGKISGEIFSDSAVSDAYSWVENKIGTREVSESEINANNHILWRGSQQLGWTPGLYHLNRSFEHEKKYNVTYKKSALDQLIIPALKDRENPLYLLSDAEVLSIDHEKHGDSYKATSVTVKMKSPWLTTGIIYDLFELDIPQGEIFKIKAKNIVLASGAFGSPALLQKSGIDEIVQTIGKGIIIHPSIPVLGEFENRIESSRGLTASVYNDHFALDKKEGYLFESMDGSPEYLAVMTQGDSHSIFSTVSKFNYMAGFGVMLIDSVSMENRVVVNKDKVEIHYVMSDFDKERMISGIKKAAKIMFRAGAKKVIVPSVELNRNQYYFSSEEELLEELKNFKLKENKTIVTSAHMQASNKMGNSQNTSVVDHQFKVWNFRNLFIVDGSVFPESIGANPMQSIYTWAKIFADSKLKEDAYK